MTRSELTHMTGPVGEDLCVNVPGLPRREIPLRAIHEAADARLCNPFAPGARR